MSTPAPTPPRRAAIIFIFITVALDMLALGVIIPVLPKLILTMSGRDETYGAHVYGAFGTVFALMQFTCSPVLGALSDRFGRRPVILTSCFGLGVDYVLMALAPSLAWLFVGRVISGITSSNIGTASAYVADVLPPDKRAQGFGMLGVAFGLGFVLGPAIGGLLGDGNPRLPFWVAAGLSTLNFAYGLLALPESLPRAQRGSFEWRRANPLGSLRLLREHPGLGRLAGVNFLAQVGHASLPSVFVLYASYRYHWGERMVGLTLAGVGVCSAVVQGALVGPIVKRLGERRALWLGLVFGAVGFAIYGWAPSGGLFFVGVPVMALWGVSGPAIQGLMSSRVHMNEQGKLQGANSSLMGVAELVGPGLYTGAFAYFIGKQAPLELPGAPFLLAACLLASAALLSLGAAPRAATAA